MYHLPVLASIHPHRSQMTITPGPKPGLEPWKASDLGHDDLGPPINRVTTPKEGLLSACFEVWELQVLRGHGRERRWQGQGQELERRHPDVGKMPGEFR